MLAKMTDLQEIEKETSKAFASAKIFRIELRKHPKTTKTLKGKKKKAHSMKVKAHVMKKPSSNAA